MDTAAGSIQPQSFVAATRPKNQRKCTTGAHLDLCILGRTAHIVLANHIQRQGRLGDVNLVGVWGYLFRKVLYFVVEGRGKQQ